ncbi:MAG: cysteine--tRNA ligase [Candidatus Lokiarchaeota archaeon]|nr:cysteine--tRNA ligase [Candidatus Lokiarchaeota archaeon]
MMKVYNSLTFQKEEFVPLEPEKVKMYVCGVTVYGSPHLGHAKSAIAFDLIHRYLKYKGYEVNIVKNYTDIDDKIIKSSQESNEDYRIISKRYIDEYEEIMEMLNVEKDTRNPRATEVIDLIIKFTQELISKGHAYERNGSVYFSVKSFPKYNSILQRIKEHANNSEEEDYLVDQDTAFGEDKLDKRDFALWKKMKEGEPYWESPWGKGRPGWHIECSVMILNYLGETIDIHGGGQDLRFPHHRNEIAQSESYSGKPFAKYFLHNGYVNVNNEKMSKSLNNFFTVADIIKDYDPLVIRWYLISSHYRSSNNYTPDSMEPAKKTYNRLINTIKKVNYAEFSEETSKQLNVLNSKIIESKDKIIEAMDDDFDTPVALAELLTLFREINKAILQDDLKINQSFKNQFLNYLKFINEIFGIFPFLKSKTLPFSTVGTNEKDNLIKSLINLIVDTRNKLREKKLYDISDIIRDRLKELGLDIEDKKVK